MRGGTSPFFFKPLRMRSTWARRHLFPIALTLSVTASILYYVIGANCLQDRMNDFIEEGTRDEIQLENLMPDKMFGTLFRNETAVKILLDFNNKPVAVEKEIFQKALQEQPPRETKRQPDGEVWSKEWPRVNLKNCSDIVYMDKGVNSPEHIRIGEYPRTGIVSFPGSGNTWSRHLIQQATGLWTGSVYHDRGLYEGGFKAELNGCDDNSTVAIKAHHAQLDVQRYCVFDRAVLVIRDPFRAVLSEFNWRTTARHTGIADKRLFKMDEWKNHVISRSKRWFTSTAEWIERFADSKSRPESGENAFTSTPDASKKLLLVSYERLKRYTVGEMERIVKFLRLPAFRRQCVQNDVDGNFHRASKSSESITCLFKENKLNEIVLERIKDLLKVTHKYGLGNIVKDFEGVDGDEISDKC